MAQEGNIVVGGLVAYELKKFERERSEIFIYNFAISPEYQRRGIATTLVKNLKEIAEKRGIATIFVQVDKVDKSAISFYKSLNGQQTDTYNFEIEL